TAIDSIRRALERATSKDAIVALGQMLADLSKQHLSDPTVTLEALKRIRKKVPGHVPTLLSLAEACASLKLWTEAAEAATSALGTAVSPIDQLAGHLWLAQIQALGAATHRNASAHAADAEKIIDSLTSPGPEASTFATLVDAGATFLRLSALHRQLGA